MRELVLDEGVINDSTLASFIDQVDLVHLRLRMSPITDESAVKIAGTQKYLKILNVPQGDFGPEGFSAIAEMSNLSHLRLGGKRIDDQCVASVSKMTSLQSLHLIGPSITGRSLTDIAAMENLQSFYLDDCVIPDKDWEAFFAARKNIHVHIDQAHHDRDPGQHAH